MPKQICVIGGGNWGRRHVQSLDQLGILGGIVEIDPNTRSQLATDFPHTPQFSQLSELDEIGLNQFDGFVIATPVNTHYALAKFLLSKGKHVLVEKPLASCADEARELEHLAQQTNANLMVGHVLLFHSAFRKIKELIDSGRIGHLQYLYSNRLNLGTVRTEVNSLWSFAPHDVSLFQYFVDTYPEEITAQGGAFLQPHLHDTTLTMLRYPNNVVAHSFVSWLHPFKEHRMVVIGSKGMLSFEDTGDKEIWFYEKGIDWVRGEPIPRDGPSEIIPHSGEAPLTAELRYFAQCLDGHPVQIATGQSAIEVLTILESASNSLSAPSRNSHLQTTEQAPNFVHPTSVIDPGSALGRNSRVWHFSHVQEGARVGERCSLGQNVYVGSDVRIGNDVKIQNNVSVYEGVELEDDVFCGPSVVFTNVRDPRSPYPKRETDGFEKTRVQRGATLGANATIVCGTNIGRYAFVAAGAVVTHDVPDYVLVAGVPARPVGFVCQCGERLQPVESKDAELECQRCASRYIEAHDGSLRPTFQEPSFAQQASSAKAGLPQPKGIDPSSPQASSKRSRRRPAHPKTPSNIPTIPTV